MNIVLYYIQPLSPPTPSPPHHMSFYFDKRYQLLSEGIIDVKVLNLIIVGLEYDEENNKEIWMQEYDFREKVLHKWPDDQKILDVAFDYPEEVSIRLERSYNIDYEFVAETFLFAAARPFSYWYMCFGLSERQLKHIVPNVLRDLGCKRDMKSELNIIKNAYLSYKVRHPDAPILEVYMGRWHNVL